MDEMLPMSAVAELVGINRNTIASWVKAKRIKSQAKMVRNVRARLVSVAEVRAIVAKGVRPGRPPKVKA